MSEKVIMLGNEAIARGAYEAGVKVFRQHILVRLVQRSVRTWSNIKIVYTREWSLNEKVATEVRSVHPYQEYVLCPV